MICILFYLFDHIQMSPVSWVNVNGVSLSLSLSLMGVLNRCVVGQMQNVRLLQLLRRKLLELSKFSANTQSKSRDGIACFRGEKKTVLKHDGRTL